MKAVFTLQARAGLGLAIVRRIRQWHGGDCWLQDSSLGGVKFVLRYPRHNT
ncbi:ATP-binding protein [Paraglaciecola sp. L1A13]|uniref:ATP-binding protein n=1 Tax=Paraglaciecola sp. L1A13 TaxID=2686359 RepID=UPI00351A697C